MRPRLLNLLTIIALAPSAVMGIVLAQEEPDAVYRLVAVVGVLLLAACAVPLTLAIVSTVVARRDARAAQAPGAVGLGLAVALAVLTVPPFLDRVLPWMH